MGRKRPIFHLVLDFDGTITVDDTTAVIGNHCIAKAIEEADGNVRLDDMPKSMQYYGEKYSEEYKEWKKQNSAEVEQPRKTIAEEVAYLSRSRLVEQNSYARVKNAICSVPGRFEEKLNNASQRDYFMMTAGRHAVQANEVRIRDRESLEKLISKSELGIVSVSWSRRFIVGALLEANLLRDDETLDVIPYFKCNEILAPDTYDEAGRPDILCTAQDKADAVQELWQQFDRKDPREFDEGGRIRVYIGDSTTDIGCLTGPAIGMYFHKEDKVNDPVLEILDRLGIEYRPISDMPTHPDSLQPILAKLEDPEDPQPVVCLVQSFKQIDDWVCKVGKDYHYP